MCGYPVTEDAKLETESVGDSIRQILRENPAALSAFMDIFKNGTDNKPTSL